MELKKVPKLNISDYDSPNLSTRKKFIDKLYSSFREFGFVVIKNHSIALEDLSKSQQSAKELFNLPLENKIKYFVPNSGGQRGYTPFGKEHAKGSNFMDLKEFWHVGRDTSKKSNYNDKYPENVWPQELPLFRPTSTALFSSLESLGDKILEALTSKLGVPTNYFKEMTEHSNSVLRLLHYPPIPSGTDSRCIRAAAHEDINLLTLLVSASSGGLELKNQDGTWSPVDANPEEIIVNVGDMLSRITNDTLPSKTHRVVNPSASNTSRYSSPFFIHPRNDFVLKCLDSCKGTGEKYAPITSDDFLMQRLKEIGLKK